MRLTLTESGKNLGEFTLGEFIGWYHTEFGYSCGNPAAIATGLKPDQNTYLGRGFSVYRHAVAEDYLAEFESMTKEYSGCRHPKKYTQKFQTFQFDYCPDCKKEV